MIPLSVTEKLLQLLEGGQLPASSMKHAIIREMVNEGIILERVAGRTKSTLYITDTGAFDNWVFNKYSIHNLREYIEALKNENTLRADLVKAGGDSKIKPARPFKGFLVNSYLPIDCLLDGKPVIIHPEEGMFQFVYDYEQFIPPPDVVIVGVENAENFRYAARQKYLFEGVRPLFVSRYPQGQNKDLIRWLQKLPNRYLHFGDYDFAGINIYLQEYKKHLPEKARFFIPDNIEQLLQQHGNKRLYDQQHLNAADITEDGLNHLVALLHKYKKGLEQEALIVFRR